MGPEQVEAKGLLRELRSIARCGRQVWGMVPRGRKLALLAALAVISVGSFANARILVGIGALVDRVKQGMDAGLPSGRDLAGRRVRSAWGSSAGPSSSARS